MLVRLQGIAFYLGLAMLLSHELDAMTNHEWRVLPLLRSFSDGAGRSAFVILHVPIFALLIVLVASLNPKTRQRTWHAASGFLIAHAILHYLFSSDSAYEFSSVLSSTLIYGAAFCGAIFFAASWLNARQAARGQP